MPEQIRQIRAKLPNQPNFLETPLQAVMPFKENQLKFSQNEKGEITGLNLARCGLTIRIWQEIQKIPGLTSTLQVLNLCENELTELDFSADFQNLQELNLAENKSLARLSFSAPMPRLERLDASECQISDFSLLAGFDCLRWLDLRKTGLKTVRLSACSALEALDLSGNALEEFALPASFAALKHLFLNENNLAVLDFQADLTKLQTLNLEKNNLPKIDRSFLDPFPNLQFLRLNGNPLTTALTGFLEDETNSLVSVCRFFREISDGTDVDNECKILLIGNGNVGKSCLVERLVHNRFRAEWESTHAISLASHDLYGYRLNLWDFGGQDIYHATHRLFMQSEAVYLLLWDLETEKLKPISRTEAGKLRTYDQHPLGYWLDYAFYIGGKKCPVVVVQTKILKEGHEKAEPPGNIRQKNRGRFEFFEFENIDSSENDWSENGFDELLLTLKKAVKRIQPKKEIPLKYAELRRYLRDLQKAGKLELDMADFLREAEQLKIEAPELVLEKWLVKTGVVYHRKGLFKDKIILNQEKAIKAIYTIFDREGLYYKLLQGENGRFSGSDMEKYWEGCTDNEAEREPFISFMTSCEMCFETTPKTEEHRSVPFAERTFVAPQLLPDEKPKSVVIQERNWKKQPQMLHLRLSHEFLHYGIIQSFIVRTQKLAGADDLWKNGILLLENEENALIEVRGKEILVSAAPSGRALFQKTRNLLRDLRDATSIESISHNGTDFVVLDELKNHPAANPQIKTTDGKFVEVEPFRVFLGLDDNLGFVKVTDDKPEFEKMMLDKMDKTAPDTVPMKPNLLDSTKRTTKGEIWPIENPGVFQEPKNSESMIYISYKWGGASGAIVDKIDKTLQERGITIIRDKRNLGYRGSIQAFMKDIGRGNKVIVVIGKDYLQSDNCMFELSHIYLNRDFHARVFPVILADADIYKPLSRVRYIKFWDEKIAALDAELKTVERGTDLTELQNELNNYAKIRASFDKMAFVLKDMNALDPEIHQNENFQSLYAALLSQP